MFKSKPHPFVASAHAQMTHQALHYNFFIILKQPLRHDKTLKLSKVYPFDKRVRLMTFFQFLMVPSKIRLWSANYKPVT